MKLSSFQAEMLLSKMLDVSNSELLWERSILLTERQGQSILSPGMKQELAGADRIEQY